jgi:hypothetical protein
MDRNQIHEMLTSEPFEPFRIRLADGSHYDILNPGLVVPLQTKLMVAFPKDDRFAVVSNYQIVAMETLPNRGGKPRRKRSA